MQLRKTMWMLTALSAMSVMMVACGGDEEIASCTSDAQCSDNEVCQTAAGVCVQTCEQASDCPDSAKNCEALSSSDTRKVCKCTVGTRFCADAYGEGFTCSATTRVCTDKDDTNPNPDPGGSCTGTGQSTCAYGQFCSASKCTAVPAPTCENYQNFSGKSQLGTTGTIIYSARVESSANDSTFCGAANPQRVKVALSAYSSTPFPDNKDQLNGFFYVIVNGTASSGAATVSSSAGNYTVTGANRENAQIIVNLCRPSGSTTTSTGFYFTSGNFYCYQANHP
ncbi:hypothetical protein [Stigmatella aurantiaca]|uniref:Conserved uncharacterized protein n=1 Tax=Stigmatella aurantiaca (strain DW4/3-1) TaxID=378806 RepID=E3FU92_STIAD|nr:hypothetical protein [Stigmatella aurantiaca]ADO73411.1 conserved uncharacterized protein [Stigmatella aurantiaca DW4/3-1]